MVKSCGHRLLRFIAVCASFALISLLILPWRWSTTHEENAWVGVASQTDDSPGLDLLLNSDTGRLELPVNEILFPDLVPPDVHFIWCGERWFEFKNYLSVMSVRRAMQPDKIYIHYERIPPLDRVYYHQVWHSVHFLRDL